MQAWSHSYTMHTCMKLTNVINIKLIFVVYLQEYFRTTGSTASNSATTIAVRTVGLLLLIITTIIVV